MRVAQVSLVFSWSKWNSSAELPWSALGRAEAGGVVFVVGGGERKEVRGLRGGGGRALSAHLHLLVAEVRVGIVPAKCLRMLADVAVLGRRLGRWHQLVHLALTV